MSAAADASQPTTQPDPQPSRSGRLLSLIRKLIDYGTALAATVRQRVASDPIFARTGFGTADLAVIFARIARGLHLAQALEARVLHRAAWLDQGPKLGTPPPAPKPRPPASPPAEASDPRLAHLPTAEQIAALVRRRPIGAVIADIYRDLGILLSHPLWRECSRRCVSSAAASPGCCATSSTARFRYSLRPRHPPCRRRRLDRPRCLPAPAHPEPQG
jgi:hypothetical protein